MPRILLAEDDDAVRNMLRAVLERGGFEVVAVANLGEARRKPGGRATPAR